MSPPSPPNESLLVETISIIPFEAKVLLVDSSTNKFTVWKNDSILTANVTTYLSSKTNSKPLGNVARIHKRKLKQQKSIEERIINGELAENGQFPYQAALMIKSGRNQYRFICGGSILNASFVLTAAHCHLANKEYYIIAGDVDRESPYMQRFRVDEFRIRPGYNSITLQGDIALIKIKGSFWEGSRAFWSWDSTELIAPIKIIDYEIKDRTETIVSGWGRTKDGGDASQYLLWVKLKLMSKIWCSLKNLHWLTGMICLESADKAVCQGDSGGPAVVGTKLAGIVSWGKGACESMENPNVFTDVYYYRKWILYNQSCITLPSLPALIVTSVLGLAVHFYYI